MRSTMKATKWLLAAVLVFSCLLSGCGKANLTDEDRVLRNADPEGKSQFLLGTEIPKNTVESLTFVGDLEAAPEDAADVSETQKGGVLLWTEAGEQGLKKVYVGAPGGVIAPADCSYLVSSCEDQIKLGKYPRSLKSVTLGGALDGSRAENLSHMFEGCGALETVDLTGFAVPAARDLSFLFADCKSLTSLDLSGLATAGAEDLHNMLRYCVKLETLTLGDFQTGKVTDFGNMFAFCYNLKELDLGSFVTGSAQNMNKMFYQCKNLETLNVTSFDTAAVTNFSGMFGSCKSLTSLDLSGFQLGDRVNTQDMFNKCPKSMELITENETLRTLFGTQSR